MAHSASNALGVAGDLVSRRMARERANGVVTLPLVEGFSFPGSFEDASGLETLTWHVMPTTGSGVPGYDVCTTIRDIAFSGIDFDALEAEDPALAASAGFRLGRFDELRACALGGDLPCAIDDAGTIINGVVNFRLDLPEEIPPSSEHLRLRMTARDETFEVGGDGWFEERMLELNVVLPDEIRLVCCHTCLFSDYSPYGHGLMGMLCHRGTKQQYLAVRSKLDYFAVPVTEQVPETYLCPHYEPRVPGTGYRG